MDETFKKIEAIVVREVPEIENSVAFIGGSSWRARGSNAGEMRIALKPVRKRTRSSDEIASALRRKLMFLPGVKVRTRPGRGLFLLRIGTAGSERVQLEVRGHDLEISDALARRVLDLVENTDGVTDAKMSRETGTPEELIIVDRQKAADLKLTVSKIANMLQTVISGTSAGNYRDGGTEHRILVKLKDAEKKGIKDILDLPITNADGEPVGVGVLLGVLDLAEGEVRKRRERVLDALDLEPEIGQRLGDLVHGSRGFEVVFQPGECEFHIIASVGTA